MLQKQTFANIMQKRRHKFDVVGFLCAMVIIAVQDISCEYPQLLH